MRAWVILLAILPYAYQDDVNNNEAQQEASSGNSDDTIINDERLNFGPLMLGEKYFDSKSYSIPGLDIQFFGTISIITEEPISLGTYEKTVKNTMFYTQGDECVLPNEQTVQRTTTIVWSCGSHIDLLYNDDSVPCTNRFLMSKECPKETFIWIPLDLNPEYLPVKKFEKSWYDPLYHETTEVEIDLFEGISQVFWDEFSISWGTYENHTNDTMHYTQGDWCWNGLFFIRREATIQWHCGLKTKVDWISEPTRCIYEIQMTKKCTKDIFFYGLDLDVGSFNNTDFKSYWYSDTIHGYWGIDVNVFSNIEQSTPSGEFTFNMGYYLDTQFPRMIYNKGDEKDGCESSPRSAIIHWRCGFETEIIYVAEIRKCTYRVEMTKKCPYWIYGETNEESESVSNSRTDCQQKRKEAIHEGAKYIPTCDGDGTWAPLQTENPDDEKIPPISWCDYPDGYEIPDSRKLSPLFQTTETCIELRKTTKLTDCQQAQKYAEADHDIYIPSCASDGTWAPLQSVPLQSFAITWCVYSNGYQIPHSRRDFPPYQTEESCTELRTERCADKYAVNGNSILLLGSYKYIDRSFIPIEPPEKNFLTRNDNNFIYHGFERSEDGKWRFNTELWGNNAEAVAKYTGNDCPPMTGWNDTLGNPLSLTVTPGLTKCQKESKPIVRLPRAYIPQCDEDGNFKPEQIGYLRWSFCVDTNGQFIPGTALPPTEKRLKPCVVTLPTEKNNDYAAEENPVVEFCTGLEKLEDLVVNCSPAAISASVSICAFLNRGLNIKHITLSEQGPPCRSYLEDGNVTFTIPTNKQCGTQIEKGNDQLIYSNKIHSFGGKQSGVITRSRSVEVDFSCALNLDKLVSLDHGIKPLLAKLTEIVVPTKNGKFEVSMGLFTDKKFDVPITDPNYQIKVPDPLFIELELSPGGLVLDATKCWATPSDDPKGDPQYVFIENSCGVVPDVEIYNNVSGRKVNFKLDSFSFVDLPEAKIFIHCQIHLCDPDIDSCKSECGNSRRRRRSTNSDLLPIAIGPVRIRKP